ncbi:unnamed protein product, partial [Haemonchus placei]|uniref:AA_permease domain-containing protein n=1 Tax=Haemonchus placei TaxID=6290 RepID=A0A0N4X281_HAEPC
MKKNRFQVFKTEPDDSDAETPRKQKSGSEPPPAKNVIERKVSSTGRFMVMSDNPNGVADRPTVFEHRSTDEDDASKENGIQPKEQAAPRSKGVHFSVGDKERDDDDPKREQAETNTTINLKSWRPTRNPAWVLCFSLTSEGGPAFLLKFEYHLILRSSFLGLGSMIVLLASLVTSITAISTCAICTNGDVKGGGAYFLISRSLGPEFGGSIGLIFSVANAVGAAMYIVGFAETVRDLLREASMKIIDAGMWDVRIVGFVTCIVLMGIVFIGTAFESKMQMGLLVILVASIIDYMIGSFLPINEEMELRGATGYNLPTLIENFLPSFRGEDFFSVFAVYFPAATGIMAGANISG